jgi:hypothetical protein
MQTQFFLNIFDPQLAESADMESLDTKDQPCCDKAGEDSS